MSYNASTLKIHEVKIEKDKTSSTFINSSCWTILTLSFVALIFVSAFTTVGTFKNFVMTEELHID